MGNFSIALSGLQADSVALNTIGVNLANLNTTAYKAQATSFADLLYQQIGESGSGEAIQVGVCGLGRKGRSDLIVRTIPPSLWKPRR